MEMRQFAIGVDIGGTTVKTGLFDTAGEMLFKWEIPTDTRENGCHIIEDVAASVRKETEERGFSLSEIKGIGIGVPGPVDGDEKVEVCPNLGWRDKDPASELSKRLGGMAAHTGNDANVAALGEQWLGAGRGTKNLMMLTLGTGVGGGVIADGRILSGSHGLGGEIGHMTVNPYETEACSCGNHGCLEQYASATGIVRVTKKLLKEEKMNSCLSGTEFSAKDVFDAAKAGDEAAQKAVDMMGKMLGIAMANVSLLLDPERFVIGGGVSKAGDFLLDVLKKYYDQFLCLSKKRAEIVTAELGNDAGICGAARMVL